MASSTAKEPTIVDKAPSSKQRDGRSPRWCPPPVPLFEWVLCAATFFATTVVYAYYTFVAHWVTLIQAEHTFCIFSWPAAVICCAACVHDSGWQRDREDIEWELFVHVLPDYALVLCMCSAVTAATDYCNMQPGAQRALLIVTYALGHVYLVAVLCAVTCALVHLHALTRCTALVWLAALALIQYDLYLGVHATHNWALAVWIVAYRVARSCATLHMPCTVLCSSSLLLHRLRLLVSALSLVSFCTSTHRTSTEGVLERTQCWLHYSLYPPYTVLLIVVYNDFHHQWHRRSQTHSRSSAAWHIGRLGAHVLLYELVLTCTCVQSVMSDESLWTGSALSTADVFSVPVTAGHMFYLKYLVIFGVARCAALLDNMQPPGLPACIYRISLYANMWRTFDRGLYQFMKTQVYIPIVSSGYRGSSVLGTVASYTLVLWWHGYKSNKNFWWLGLNCAEVFLEHWASTVYQLCAPAYGHVLSGQTTRRCVMFAQNVCVLLGLTGIYYFLSDDGVGHAIMQRMWYALSPSLVLFLVVWGYCWNTMCLQLNIWVDGRTHEKKQ